MVAEVVEAAGTLAGYRAGGVSTETGYLRNILAHAGVRVAHTGAAPSEALVLGLGGGIGGGYWSWEFKEHDFVWLSLGVRANWQDCPSFTADAVRRLGGTLEVHQTGARKQAEATLREAIGAGRAAIVAVDQATLPYHGLPEGLRKMILASVAVCGIDEARGLAAIDDRAPSAWPVPLERLAEARATQPYQKNRLTLVTPPDAEVDLAGAVIDAVRDCGTKLLEPPIRNFGVPAWKKWADLLVHPKDAKGWPKVFGTPARMLGVLICTYQSVTAGAGGDALRGLYAAFLDEAAEITGRHDLRDLAAAYRDVAGQWEAFAAAALPDDVEVCREARDLIDQRRRLFEEVGAAATDEIAVAQTRLDTLKAAADLAEQLTPERMAAIRAEMHERLTRIHADEVRLAEALRSV